jgi:sensor histidine kinase YesM
MKQYSFIFSDSRKYRVRRHLIFWSLWWVFQVVLYAYVPLLVGLDGYLRFFLSCIDSVFFLVPHMFMAYSLMYFVIPRYIITGKYVHSVISVTVICLVTALMSSAISLLVLERIHQVCVIELGIKQVPVNYNRTFWLSLLAGLRGGLTIGGLAAAIKLMKYWYIKQQRNLQLQKENAESQLQLLKAQVHPHFLFNTLNNIFSHTQGVAPVASQLALGLSDMLRFMIYECNQSLVPLSKELKMIQDYITLEKIRYDDRLDIHVEVPENTDDLSISPLLLLPFVENCFKHGTSHILDQPWLSLEVRLDDNKMFMKLVNGKAPYVSHYHSPGIGISNARKRLELIYPGKHELVITDDLDVYIVNLSIELERKPGLSIKQEESYMLTHHE